MSTFIWVLILVFALVIGNIMLITRFMPKNTKESDASGRRTATKASGEEDKPTD